MFCKGLEVNTQSVKRSVAPVVFVPRKGVQKVRTFLLIIYKLINMGHLTYFTLVSFPPLIEVVSCPYLQFFSTDFLHCDGTQNFSLLVQSTSFTNPSTVTSVCRVVFVSVFSYHINHSSHHINSIRSPSYHFLW